MKRYLKILVIVACLPLFAVIIFKAQPTSAQAKKDETAGEHFKNIKVLSDMPADQMGKVMNMMSASLGVNCAFCHASNDDNFEKDGNEHKDMARKMITMTLELNKSQFNGRPEINCNTCHNGISHPQPSFPLTPPVPVQERPKQPVEKPSTDKIIDDYITAVGGAARLEKIKSREVVSTRIEPDGKTTEPETKWFGDGKYFGETMYGTVSVTEGFDGVKGWKAGNKAAIYMKPDEAEQLKREAQLFSPLNLKTIFTKLDFRLLDRVDGRLVYLVLATADGGTRERLYFDVETGLLVRRSASTQTIFGGFVYQVDYTDYKAFDGVKIPMTVKYAMPHISWTSKVKQVKNNIVINVSKFTAPMPAK